MNNRGKKRDFKKDRSRSKDFFPREMRFKERSCRFCKDKIKIVDYKDLNRLQRYVTEKGKILSSRLTGNCARHQRKIAQAIKRARFLALLPFVKR